MILITGASGQLGQIVVSELLKTEDASNIAVLVRDEQKAANYQQLGITIKVGDYHNTQTLNTALTNIEKVLLISSSDFNNRLQQHKNVIDAAKNNGVKHIAYTGVSMKDIETSPLKNFLSDHFETEEYIKESGLNYTFLRNTLYADVLPMFLGENVIETGIFFPAGDGRVAFATRVDLGIAAANAIKSGIENKTYELTSDTNYSFSEIAKILSELSGKAVSYTDAPEDSFVKMLTQIGLPEPIIQMSAAFAGGMKQQNFNQTFPDLTELLGRKPQALNEYLKQKFIK